MKKYLVIPFIILISLFALSGCGDVELNEDEQRVFDALTKAVDNFIDPASVKVIKCSDPFPQQNEYFVSTDNVYYSPNFPTSDYECVFIELNAAKRDGGNSYEVYQMPIDKDDEHYGGAYSFNECVAKDFITDIPNFASDHEIEKEKLRVQMNIAAANFTASSLGLDYAKSIKAQTSYASYPISQGKNIDVGKLNKALEKYMKDKGIS